MLCRSLSVSFCLLALVLVNAGNFMGICIERSSSLGMRDSEPVRGLEALCMSPMGRRCSREKLNGQVMIDGRAQ